MKQKIVKMNEFFSSVMGEIEKKGNLPDILDYTLADYRNPAGIYDIMFDVIPEIHYGGNEGIYIDVYADGSFGKDYGDAKVHIGTIKTLLENDEAVHKMAKLAADIIIESRKYLEENEMQLIRRGYKVTYISGSGMYTANLETARQYLRNKEGFITDLYTQEVVK